MNMREKLARKYRTRFNREWQLMKVELRLSCPDGGGDWRDNLLAQQAALRAMITAARNEEGQ